MSNINNITISGRVGQDPQITTFASGNCKADFSLASTDSWKDKEGNRQDETQWHRIEAWKGLASLAEGWVKKGTFLVVSGQLRYNSYTSKEGHKVTIAYIRANSIDIVSTTPKNNTEKEYQKTEVPPETHTEFLPGNEDDDLPF